MAPRHLQHEKPNSFLQHAAENGPRLSPSPPPHCHPPYILLSVLNKGHSLPSSFHITDIFSQPLTTRQGGGQRQGGPKRAQGWVGVDAGCAREQVRLRPSRPAPPTSPGETWHWAWPRTETEDSDDPVCTHERDRETETHTKQRPERVLGVAFLLLFPPSLRPPTRPSFKAQLRDLLLQSLPHTTLCVPSLRPTQHWTNGFGSLSPPFFTIQLQIP